VGPRVRDGGGRLWVARNPAGTEQAASGHEGFRAGLWLARWDFFVETQGERKKNGRLP